VPLAFVDKEGVLITKTFTFNKNSYLVDITYTIDNQKIEVTWQANLFAQIKRDNTIDPLADTSLFAMKPFLGVGIRRIKPHFRKVHSIHA